MGQLHPAAMVAPLLMSVAALWTLTPDNATRAWAWPWFALWFIGLAILLPLAAFAQGAAGSRTSSCGPERSLRAGLILLLAAPLLASFNAPDGPRAIAAAGGMALGLAAILTALSRPENREWMRPGGKAAWAVTAFALIWGTVSLISYYLFQRGPFQDGIMSLDETFGDGHGVMYPLMIDVDQMRNTATFGHANLVAGFALLLLPFPAALMLAGARRTIPVMTLAVLVAVLFSAESRLALLALAAGLVVGVLAYGDAAKRIRLLLLAGAALAVFAVASVAWSGRIRSMLDLDFDFVENEDLLNRMSQVEAAWVCGLQHFPAGAGEGTAPAIYESLRPELMGSVDGILHFHITPAHLWAVFGLTGLAAVALVFWFAWKTETRGRLAPHLAGLSAWAVASLGDYNLDQPGPVILLGLHLGTLAAVAGPLQESPRRPWSSILVTALWLPCLGLFLVRHLPARIAIEDYFERRPDSPMAGELVVMNHRLTPKDPYLLNAHAARLMELDRSHPQAIAALRSSLAINPNQEFAHTWLGWALLAKEPAEAAIHFRTSLRLNPRVPGLGEGLGRALLASGRENEAVRAFAAHSLQFPHFLMGDRWMSPPLARLQKPVLEATVLAADKLLAKPNLSRFLKPRVGFVRDLALARLKGSGEAVLRGFLAPRHPPMALFFEAWDHPEQRNALVYRALAARFRPNTEDENEMADLTRQAERLTKLFDQARGEPLAYFLLPSERFIPALPRSNFGVLHGHSRSISPPLPWDGPLGVPEAIFFGEFVMGLTGSDFEWVLGLPDTH